MAHIKRNGQMFSRFDPTSSVSRNWFSQSLWCGIFLMYIYAHAFARYYVQSDIER